MVEASGTIRCLQRERNHAGARYDGQVSIATGLREGTGVYYYANPHFVYEGGWRNGKKHGQGKLSFDGGGFYEGSFEDGEICGDGNQEWSDGSNYVGQFLRGEKHGEGLLVKADGTRYSGGWLQNRYSGVGELTLPKGDRYSGGFLAHKFHGQGSLDFSSQGLSYEGQFENGLRHGQGELKEQGGAAVYIGEFQAGKKHGQGKAIDEASGISYEGPWCEDRPERPAAAWDIGPIDSQDSYVPVGEALKEEARNQLTAANAKDKKKDKGKAAGPSDMSEIGPELRGVKGQALPELAVRLVDAEKAITAEVGRRFRATMYKERMPPGVEDPQDAERRPVNFGDQRLTSPYEDEVDAAPAKGKAPPPAAEEPEEPPSEGTQALDAQIGDDGRCIIGGSEEWLLPVYLQPAALYWLRLEDITELRDDGPWARMEPLEMPFWVLAE
eukprot:TRINITY_DN64806_c0_g1_i1.p1 TRINITY_DN64806_c0_g1~~TRINITY_DN64806_c0_g1_i1.p1  ORF type:complete len:453 (+),score=118.92 TRINITY_DN64806_c0_g1_i1:37-1359(+)